MGKNIVHCGDTGNGQVAKVANNMLLGISIEDLIGSDLGGSTPSSIVVRFQGVRSVGSVEDFCDVQMDGMNIEIVPGSLTGWVRHPSDLNDYFSFLGADEAAKVQPNMIRFQVIFDRNPGLIGTGAFLVGVDHFQILAQPD